MKALLGGTWRGTDAAEATLATLGEAADTHWPVLPELPDRGPGADPVGRTAALLAELTVDRQPHGWRIAPGSRARDGLDRRRAASYLTEDLHRWADVAGAEGVSTRRLAVRVRGPLSMLGALWLPGGERVLLDPGARRDVVDALAEGLRELVQRVRSDAAAAEVGLILDEPLAAAVHAGTLPTASGYRTARALPVDEVRRHWSRAYQAVAVDADRLWLVPGAMRASGHERLVAELASHALDLRPDATPVTLMARLGAVDVVGGDRAWETAAAWTEARAGTAPSLAVETDLTPDVLIRECERVGLDPALLAGESGAWELVGPGLLLADEHPADGRPADAGATVRLASAAGLRQTAVACAELAERAAER